MFSSPAAVHGGYLPLLNLHRVNLGAILSSTRLNPSLGRDMDQLPCASPVLSTGVIGLRGKNLPRAVAIPPEDVLNKIPGDNGDEEIWSLKDLSDSKSKPEKREASIISSKGEIGGGRLD